uniref:Uncharacterized protein n=1 Tax=Ditylenchus dipsaci TaxID=166011 RepID=A0A915EBY5_9BILA
MCWWEKERPTQLYRIVGDEANVSGKCSLDKCINILCDEGEHCRDGKSSGLHCKLNKCEKSSGQVLKQDFKQKCDPGESPQNEKCIPQDGCAQLVCELGETCLNGFCIPTTFECDNDPPAAGSLPIPSVQKI